MTTQTMMTLPTRRRFTVTEYYKMVEAGILSPEDRVELIDGEVIQMAPTGRAHNATVIRLTRLLGRRFDDAAIVSVQNSLRLDDHNEPEPDFALLHLSADLYAETDPGPADVFS